jgi:hypothetical protein
MERVEWAANDKGKEEAGAGGMQRTGSAVELDQEVARLLERCEACLPLQRAAQSGCARAGRRWPRLGSACLLPRPVRAQVEGA